MRTLYRVVLPALSLLLSPAASSFLLVKSTPSSCTTYVRKNNRRLTISSEAAGQDASNLLRRRHVKFSVTAFQEGLSRTALLSGHGEAAESTKNQFAFNMSKFRSFAQKNFFLLGMIVAMSMARALPQLGESGGILRPELFIGKFGVTCIFLLSGLSLELSELKDAASNIKLNGAVQLASFVGWPFLVGVPLVKTLEKFLPGLLPKPLLDGLLVLSCLPTTVNMCILLTSAAGGNVASALCNAVISNLLGIFVTPALLFRFFGASIELPFSEMVVKLCNKVLLPVAVGQALRLTPAKSTYEKNSKTFKRLQEIILLGIVWNAFCNAFSKGFGLEAKHVVALLGLLPALHLGSLALLFNVFKLKLFNFSRGEVVAGMFCASHKTLAFGLPLINTIFEGSPNLAAYCAPIMFIHPLQVVLGSLLVPKLRQYTDVSEVK